jgi:predicted metal-binding membrane protein
MRRQDDMDGVAAIRLVRGAVPLWVALALLGLPAWVVTVGQARDMGAGPGTMGMAFLFFVGMWVAMMAAMMLPAIGPKAAGETLGITRQTSSTRYPHVLAFGAGFLIPWAGYGVLAFLALLGTERLVESSPDTARWLGVAIFTVAGLYQFSPWKLRALHHCRMVREPEGRAAAQGSISSGLRDGAICVGCCWALMTILFAVGVMNIGAMLGLAAVIFAEKVLPRPRLIAGLAGVAFLSIALVAAFDPSILPGLHGSEMGMHPGGAELGGTEMTDMEMGTG